MGAGEPADAGAMGAGALEGVDAMAALADAALAAAAAGASPFRLAPFTVKPSLENLAAFLSPMPLTREMKSGQSLKLLFLRSSTILPDKLGPMPLTLSNSAALALFTSTAALATVAHTKAKTHKIFFNIRTP